MMRIVSSLSLDADTRRALVRAARGDSGEEVEAAIETLAQALGVIDDDGEVNEEVVRSLMDEVDLATEREPEGDDG